MLVTNPNLTLLDIMRIANVPAGQDNEFLVGNEGMLTHCFDPDTGIPRSEAAATLEGYVSKNIASFFGDEDYADEPLSARIRMMAGGIGDAAVDLWRIAAVLEQLAEDVADVEQAGVEVEDTETATEHAP